MSDSRKGGGSSREGGSTAAGSRDVVRQSPAPAPVGDASDSPRFRELERSECEAFLRRNNVGRIAFVSGMQVEILPIHYAHDGAWLYCRTAPGDKLEDWRQKRWVAFEVDEVAGLFDWTSVVVHGGLYILADDGSEDAAALLKHALKVLRRVIPPTGTDRDPVPHRTVIFRIHIDEMEGRRATSNTSEERAGTPA